MAANRIFLGVDTTSNLAVSLELAGEGIYFVSITQGRQGEDLCKFICPAEQLEGVLHGRSVEITGHAGNCYIHSAGDEVVFEFQRTEDATQSTCSLSMNSFERVLAITKNRAYIN